MLLESALRVARFELRRSLRDPYTWIGLIAFMLVAAVGAYFYWRSLPPRPPGARLFGEAYLLALVIAFHSGFARDRQYRFDRYLVANFAPPSAVFFGHLLCVLALLALLGAFAFIYALVLALGDFSYALEYPVHFFYISLLMLPFVVLLELLLNSRMPVPVLLIVFFLVLMLYSRMGNVERLAELLGMSEDITVASALLRIALALLITTALYPLFVRRLGRVSLARE